MIDASIRARQAQIQQKVEIFALSNGYPIEIVKSQRIVGPRKGAPIPPSGTEIYISNLPKDLFEDELMPFFGTRHQIYKFRLMLSLSGLSTRGSAYITYDTKADAEAAITQLDNSVFGDERIAVRKSMDNRRIFIGGVPDYKSKNCIWRELSKSGMENIVDVIMYRSYTDRNKNRGFVFVEFLTHNDAAAARITFKNMYLFGQRIYIDWATPLVEIDDCVMNKVKKLFVRNLNVIQSAAQLTLTVRSVLGDATFDSVEKIYKNRDYAFIHFKTRRDAQKAISLLEEYYKETVVEVNWAKPVPGKKIDFRYNKEEDTPPHSQFTFDYTRPLDMFQFSEDVINPRASVSPPFQNPSTSSGLPWITDPLPTMDLNFPHLFQNRFPHKPQDPQHAFNCWTPYSNF